jgi:hypothetical protein
MAARLLWFGADVVRLVAEVVYRMPFGFPMTPNSAMDPPELSVP